jgi:hypothetical protein
VIGPGVNAEPAPPATPRQDYLPGPLETAKCIMDSSLTATCNVVLMANDPAVAAYSTEEIVISADGKTYLVKTTT